MKTPRLYRRLARGLHIGVVHGGWASLHLAPDHLLLRTSNLFVENYRRFYFADIEAITICKTNRRDLWTGGLAIGLFLSVLPMLLSGEVTCFFSICAGIFVCLMAYNLLRGATCRTKLQTRVQSRALPLRRVRKALRVTARISGPIAAAQATIAVTENSLAAAAPPARSTPAAVASEPPPLPGEKGPRAGALHLAMITFLMLAGGTAFVSAFEPLWAPAAYLTYALAMTNLALAVAALVRQIRRPVPRRLVLLAWISALTHGLMLPAVYTVFGFVYGLQPAQLAQRGSAVGMQMPLSALRNLPGFTVILFAYGAIVLVLGSIGCVLFLRTLQRPRATL